MAPVVETIRTEGRISFTPGFSLVDRCPFFTRNRFNGFIVDAQSARRTKPLKRFSLQHKSVRPAEAGRE